MPRPSASFSTSGRANAAVLAITVLALLAGSEIVLRLVYHPPIVGSVIRYDPVVGWSLVPDASLVTDVTERGIHPRIDINHLGLRDRNIALRKPSGRHRILVVGDSVVFGSGLNAGERFSDLLASALADQAEVINAGVPGWGNDQELLYYETFLRRLQPDVVVLTFTGNNDVVNNALDGALLEGGTKPRFELAGDSLIVHPPAPPARIDAMTRIKRVLRRSRLLVFARRRLQRVAYRHEIHEEVVHQFHGFESYRHLSHWSVYGTGGGDAIESAWSVTEAILNRFAADCRADSAVFIVFALPLKLEVDDAWRRQLIQQTEADSTRIDMTLPYRRLAAFCAAHDIEFHYPIDEFRAEARNQTLYFRQDSHPNVRANQIAAHWLESLPSLRRRVAAP